VTGRPIVFVRKKPKDYGTCKFAEGIEIKNKNLCLIEDVITTGGQVLLSAQDLRQDGAIVNNVLCVIDRGTDSKKKLFDGGQLNLSPLFTNEELKSASLIPFI
jgi:orotate phosphoribosyltransferase